MCAKSSIRQNFPIQLELPVIMYDLDSVSNCNIYRVNVTSNGYDSAPRCSVFLDSVKGLNSAVVISNDCGSATTFMVASHLEPETFQKLVTKRFHRFRTVDNPFFLQIFF